MLVPINLGGVLMSLYQGVTGRRIPFGRTLKVAGRTAAPVAYLVAEYALLGYLLYATAVEALAGRWGNAVFALTDVARFLDSLPPADHGAVTFRLARPAVRDRRSGMSRRLPPRATERDGDSEAGS